MTARPKGGRITPKKWVQTPPLEAGRSYGLAVGWCRSAEGEAEVKQATRARLFRKLGNRRAGGFQWRIATSRSEALDFLRLLEEGRDNAEDPEVITECRQLLKLYGGRLVIAIAQRLPETP